MDHQQQVETARLPVTHVGRQAIYDRDGALVAYELLFRDAENATSATLRSAAATSRVIVAAFTEFGIEQLVGGRSCFVNVTREFLVGELPVPFGPDDAVIEVVETVDIDDEVVGGVTRLVDDGYTVALDDFMIGRHERLLSLATYVKVVVRELDETTLDRVVEVCREHPQLQLVAEQLETEDDLRRAYDRGFEFFQGHILGRTHVASTTSIAPGRLHRLQLLGALNAAEADFDEVVGLIARDAAIAYRLLQACNAAASGLTARVSTIKQAAALLGLDKIRQWVTLMVLSDVAEATEEQLTNTMARARMCETVAHHRSLPADAAFTTGLLSGVADLIGHRPSDLASRLPLTDDVRRALVDGSGELGEVLVAVRSFEQGAGERLAALISPEKALHSFLEAMAWSTKLTSHSGEGSRGAQLSSSQFADLLGAYHF
ncbi:HDOD domain-containing protein [Actinoplanes sp. NPDC051470]|uniref:EAL and HDOD domain-containing protein n=1 Tax=unclassified Actinoplanes TaxID=2626549 RepID=UPI003425AFD4